MSHGSAEPGALTSHTEPMSTTVLLVGQGHVREHEDATPSGDLSDKPMYSTVNRDHDAHLPGGTAVLLSVGGHLTTSSPPDDFTWARVTPSNHHIPWVQQKAQNLHSLYTAS